MRILGLMSGTSVDAIDAAICEVVSDAERPSGLCLRLLGYREAPHPLRERVLETVRRATVTLDEITELNFLLGEVFARAAITTLEDVGCGGVDLIASHGQTMYHLVAPGRMASTLQLGEPAVIAQRTGITVVADFRVADMAVGGGGAPLTSYFDALFFAHEGRTRAVQNIGGMANVTFVPPGGPERASAFDTGPGNSLIDSGARHYGGGRTLCDRDGMLAGQGRVHAPLLAAILSHPFFSQPPPKTTGREVFGDAYAASIVARAEAMHLSPEDSMATLTAATAESIARAYRAFGPPHVDDVIVTGGGARNPVLIRELRSRLAGPTLHVHDSFGISAEAREAVAFALLGHEALYGRPANLPRCTGASRPAILGKIVPGRNYRDVMDLVSAEGRERWESTRTVRLVP